MKIIMVQEFGLRTEKGFQKRELGREKALDNRRISIPEQL
jgi:hypothetical protein